MNYRDSLEELALAGVGTLETKDAIIGKLTKADVSVLSGLCKELGIRTKDYTTDKEFGREFLENILALRFQKRPSQLQRVNSMSLFPSEVGLFSFQLEFFIDIFIF